MPETAGEELARRLDEAVAEYVGRAPSPAARVLWELEGKRLKRAAARYRAHWQAFVDTWRKLDVIPRPWSFEHDFGLPPVAPDPAQPDAVPALVIEVGGVRVHIGGRIDRVDVAELVEGKGFWVIDYKTGRAANYSAAELQRMERLQLPLYALAVEKVLLAGSPARPLGLAYWLVTDTGPKPVLPAGRQAHAWFSDPGHWRKFRARLEAWVAAIAGHVRSGAFPLQPRSEHCTETCPYNQVCRISQSRSVGKRREMPQPAAGEGPA